MLLLKFSLQQEPRCLFDLKCVLKMYNKGLLKPIKHLWKNAGLTHTVNSLFHKFNLYYLVEETVL